MNTEHSKNLGFSFFIILMLKLENFMWRVVIEVNWTKNPMKTQHHVLKCASKQLCVL